MANRLVYLFVALALIFLGAFFVPLPTCAAVQTDPTQLNYAFKPGQIHHYRMVSESEQRQDVGPFVRTVQETTFTQNVLSVKDGVATLEITYDSLRVDLQSGPQSFSYDSRTGVGEVDDAQKKMFEAILHRPCRIKVNATGQVVGASGFDAPFDEMAASLADNPFTREIVQAQKASFGNDAMKQAFSSTFLQLPEEKLELGARWSDEQEMKHQIGTLKINNANHLARYEDMNGINCARIEQKSTSELIAQSPAEFGGARFEHELESASMNATIHLASDEGLLVKSQSEVRMSLKVKPIMPDGQKPSPFMPKSIGVSTVSKTTLELVKDV